MTVGDFRRRAQRLPIVQLPDRRPSRTRLDTELVATPRLGERSPAKDTTCRSMVRGGGAFGGGCMRPPKVCHAVMIERHAVVDRARLLDRELHGIS